MKKSLEAYQFKDGEVIASIGAGGAVWEVGFTVNKPNLTFYLQDIDATLLNQNEIDMSIAYHQKLAEKRIDAKYVAVIGDEYSTKLPDDFFDKVLIINAFHEFKYPELMLLEVKRIMKVGGTLFLDEQLASFSGEIHEGCNKKLYTEIELLAFLQKNGFSVTKKVERSPYVKIFGFSFLSS